MTERVQHTMDGEFAVKPVREFAKNSYRLVKRCTKPDRKGEQAGQQGGPAGSTQPQQPPCPRAVCWLRPATADPPRLLCAPLPAEFNRISVRTAVGFVIMGFIGFFVKLIFIVRARLHSGCVFARAWRPAGAALGLLRAVKAGRRMAHDAVGAAALSPGTAAACPPHPCLSYASRTACSPSTRSSWGADAAATAGGARGRAGGQRHCTAPHDQRSRRAPPHVEAWAHALVGARCVSRCTTAPGAASAHAVPGRSARRQRGAPGCDLASLGLPMLCTDSAGGAARLACPFCLMLWVL